MKKFLKWLAYGATAFIVVLGAVAGLTQTQFFRNALRTFALDQLDSLLIAEVHLGEIRGNLVSGFSIDSVSIKVDSEYFVEAERIDIRYDPFQIPSKKINVSSLVLVRPRIALLCGPDSVWNFERMIRPVPDDSTKTPFDWPIAVHRLEIIEGVILLRPNLAPSDATEAFVSWLKSEVRREAELTLAVPRQANRSPSGRLHTARSRSQARRS